MEPVDVQAWLNDLGLPQYGPNFAGNSLPAEEFCRLTSRDLKAIGVVSLSHRRKMLAALAHMAAGKTGYRRFPGDDLPA